MKYLKSYKVFEDQYKSNDFLHELENYFSKISYDLQVNMDMRSPLNYMFIYNGVKYYIDSGEIYDDTLSRNRYIHDLYSFAYRERSLLYKDIQSLYLKIFHIAANTRALVKAIRICIYPNKRMIPEIKSANVEVRERISEFDVIKNGEVDYISVNNLFDFYEVNFNEDEFSISLENIRKQFGQE